MPTGAPRSGTKTTDDATFAVRPTVDTAFFEAPSEFTGDGLAPLVELPGALVFELAQKAILRLASQTADASPDLTGPRAAKLDEFCRTLISGGDANAAEEMLDKLFDGRTTDAERLRYLAEAAQTLGRWWMEDQVTFVDVTVGSGRILDIMRKLNRRNASPDRQKRMSIIFASVPGEQHILGVRMAADLFRLDGWRIALKVGLTHQDLLDCINSEPNCILGISIGGRRSLPALRELARDLQSTCPSCEIMVSGRGVEEVRPDLIEMGLDRIAGNIDEAKDLIAALWDARA